MRIVISIILIFFLAISPLLQYKHPITNAQIVNAYQKCSDMNGQIELARDSDGYSDEPGDIISINCLSSRGYFRMVTQQVDHFWPTMWHKIFN